MSEVRWIDFNTLSAGREIYLDMEVFKVSRCNMVGVTNLWSMLVQRYDVVEKVV